jgi:uncharacterized protein (DUF1684 family)
MFKNKFVTAGIIVAFIVAAIYSLSKSKPDFEQEIARERERYQNTISDMENSPVAKEEDFLGFRYFDAKSEWVFQAEFVQDLSGDAFPVYMTDGTTDQLPMAGKATFEKGGKKYTVLVFDEGKTLLLPFRDETNDIETYGGGRYINLDKTSNNRITIDFNKAHNFYCAYDESFICPVPPAENTLALRVEAGEKVFK